MGGAADANFSVTTLIRAPLDAASWYRNTDSSALTAATGLVGPPFTLRSRSRLMCDTAGSAIRSHSLFLVGRLGVGCVSR